METLVLENYLCLYLVQHMLHQIKAQHFYTDFGLYQLSYVLQKIVEFKDFSRLLSDFPVLFKADLIFKDFSRKPYKFSTFQGCTNPVKDFHCFLSVLSPMHEPPIVTYPAELEI